MGDEGVARLGLPPWRRRCAFAGSERVVGGDDRPLRTRTTSATGHAGRFCIDRRAQERHRPAWGDGSAGRACSAQVRSGGSPPRRLAKRCRTPPSHGRSAISGPGSLGNPVGVPPAPHPRVRQLRFRLGTSPIVVPNVVGTGGNSGACRPFAAPSNSPRCDLKPGCLQAKVVDPDHPAPPSCHAGARLHVSVAQHPLQPAS